MMPEMVFRAIARRNHVFDLLRVSAPLAGERHSPLIDFLNVGHAMHGFLIVL